MKIIIRCTPNEERRTFTVDFTDLGMTQKEWYNLTNKEKEVLLQEQVDEYDQPYWAVDDFEEK